MSKLTAAVLAVLTVAAVAIGGAFVALAVHNDETPAPASLPPALSRPLQSLPTASVCPAGQASMGCAAVKPTLTPRGAVKPTSRPPGPIFPDVSVYQGHPDWNAARPFIIGFVAKAGEYTVDSSYGYNASSARRLKITFGAYWFVRNYGCATEAARIVSVLRTYGLPAFVVLDMEVPESAGYAPCLSSQVKRALGLPVVIYTAPGTWSGGSTGGIPVWVASYGPSHPPLTFGQPAAWQYTDGIYGGATRIPGISLGDVSVNYSLFHPAPPPNPYAKYDPTVRRLPNGSRSSERGAVISWDKHGCRNPVRRPVCRAAHYRMRQARDRDVAVAHRPHHSYRSDRLGARVLGLQIRLHQTK